MGRRTTIVAGGILAVGTAGVVLNNMNNGRGPDVIDVGPQIKPLILEGTPVDWNDHRWQVGLLYADVEDNESAQFCGGALIADEWALTAAHCFFEDPEDGGERFVVENGAIDVLSGTASLDGDDGLRVGIESFFLHPDYNDSTADNDIALIRLAETPLGESIDLVTSAEESSFLDTGVEVHVTGWGLKENGEFSSKLLGVKVPMVDREKCNQPVSYNGKVTDNMFCAGYDEGIKDACKADSGGPAVVNGTLVGLISWGGQECGAPYKYGVYTRLANYEDWIANTMQSN